MYLKFEFEITTGAADASSFFSFGLIATCNCVCCCKKKHRKKNKETKKQRNKETKKKTPTKEGQNGGVDQPCLVGETTNNDTHTLISYEP